MRENCWIIIAGNVLDGLRLFGPFETREKARKFALHSHRLPSDDDWISTVLEAPDEKESEMNDSRLFMVLVYIKDLVEIVKESGVQNVRITALEKQLKLAIEETEENIRVSQETE